MNYYGQCIRPIPHDQTNHFATPHTQANYRTAFFDGALSSRSNYGAWTEAGQQDAAQRAAKHWQTLLRDFEAPNLDEGIREALEAFVERRQRELQKVNLYD